MRRKFILLFWLCLIAVEVYCQNHMDLMNTLYGEFNGDEFGAEMVSMDYNGDGYDDLIVVAPFWNDTGLVGAYFLGKVYFYWGGPNGLSNIPDYVIEGQSQAQFAPYMCNPGDMNGDGIDDLAITYSTDVPWGAYKSIAIYLGSSTPHSEPDYLATIPYTHVRPQYLGDINGDGKSDLSIWGQYYYHRYLYFSSIWLDIESDPIPFLSSSIDGGVITLFGVGDVNHDGYDDAYVTYPSNPGNWAEKKIALCYGDASASLTDSLVIADYLIESFPSSSPLGDINGDGFADFIGYQLHPYHYVWLGSSDLDSIPDLAISLTSPDHDMHAFGKVIFKYAVYGDLNGDGYDDFVCSDHEANTYNGQAGLWLGGANVNATVDLVLNPPWDWELRNFGEAKAIGDFNGDQFDDLALSCPRWMDGSLHDPGRVYVFAGNAQLRDTTVSIDDPVVPSVGMVDWGIEVYPNPCHKAQGSISVKLKGDAYSSKGQYAYGIFNIRGQRVREGVINGEELRIRCFRTDLAGLDAGVYQVSVLRDNVVTSVRRVVVY